MLQVRRSIFETNSSSIHSLTFVTSDEMDSFKAGTLLFDRWSDKLVTKEEAERNEDHSYYLPRFIPYDELYRIGYEYGGEAWAESRELPDGDVAHFICYYGHD